MLVPRLQDHLGIVAPARCARRTVTRDRRAGGAARAPLTLPRAGGRAEGGQVPPRGPGGGESCKARRRLPAWLAVRPGGGAGLARPQPLPPLRLSRRPRNAGGRGAGTPCEPPRPCLRCPSAPDARSRPTSAHAQTPCAGRGGPRGCPATLALPWARAGRCLGERADLFPGAAPPCGSGLEKERALLGWPLVEVSNGIKAARRAGQSSRCPVSLLRGRPDGKEALRNDRGGSLSERPRAAVAPPREGDPQS